MPADAGTAGPAGPSSARVASIVAAMAIVTVLVVGFTFANVTATASPAMALRLMAGHADANANYAQALIAANPSAPPVAQIRTHALASLRNSALAPEAARTLALALPANDPKVARLMDYAAGLTRRDLLTNLWLIERSVGKGDLNAALDRYDVTLRSSRGSQQLLFPILLGALADPTYVGPIAKVFQRQPVWLPAFIDFAISKQSATQHLALALGGVTLVSPPGQNLAQAILDQLTKENRHADAYLYASSIDGTVRSAGPGLRDGRFRKVGGLMPFAWLYVSDPLYGAERGDRGVTLYGNGAASGVALGQLTLLKPGSYVLSTTGSVTGGAAEWVVDCAPPSAVRLATLKLPAGQSATKEIAFRIPPGGCAAQYVRLSLRADDTANALAGEIGQVSLRPAVN